MISLPYPCCDLLYTVNSFRVDKAYVHKHKHISMISHSNRTLNCEKPKTETIITQKKKTGIFFTLVLSKTFQISSQVNSEILIFKKT